MLWGDKTPLNSEYLPWIRATFPQARYVHIVRDGRDAVTSMLRAGMQEGDIKRCCLEWRIRVQANLAIQRKLAADQYMELRYERLVTEPVAEVTRVCQFLGIEFSEAMLNTAANFHKMGDTVELDHHSNVENPINSQSIGAWRQNLTPDQIRYVNERLKPLLTRLDYL